MSLLQKIDKIRSEVQPVEKKGFNDFQKYFYIKEEDAIAAVRGLLIREKILILPGYEYVGRVDKVTTVQGVFKFVDSETAEEITFKIPGEGHDSTDKGVYKAETGALKQLLLKLFLLSSGDDPEYEGEASTKRTSKASGSGVTGTKSDEAAKESTTGTQKPSPEPPQQTATGSLVSKAQIPPYDDSAARKAYFTELSQKLGPAKAKALGEWIRKTTGQTDLRKVKDTEWGPVVATLHQADESNSLDKLLEAK